MHLLHPPSAALPNTWKVTLTFSDDIEKTAIIYTSSTAKTNCATKLQHNNITDLPNSTTFKKRNSRQHFGKLTDHQFHYMPVTRQTFD